MINLDLVGKRAVVCGSSQGIGKAVAIELAEMGASITLVARSEPKLALVKAALDRKQGQEHHKLVADFENPQKLRSALGRYIKLGNQAQILINNTGGPAPGPAHLATPLEFEKAFQMHLICNQILVQALLPQMKAQNFGRIINVISTSVKQPIHNLGVSNTIRGAVANWSKTLSNELGQFGITVNNVLPGPINTGRLNSIIDAFAKKNKITSAEQREKMANAVPLKRIAEPSEIAQVIAFLCTDSASYINGINLPVDGGRTASL